MRSTIARSYEVEQRRMDTTTTVHLFTANIAEATAKAIDLSQTDDGIAYIIDADTQRTVVKYRRGTQCKQGEAFR